MHAKVGLIAYADRFGADLAGLHGLLNGPLRGLFGGVHVLPFYRPYDGADAGFDPQDHTEVDERLGSWGDISALGGEYKVMADMIVKDVSSGSAPFQDWLARGDARTEIDASLARPVVRALCRLIRFRNEHPAFDGNLTCSGEGPGFVMSWARDDDEAVLRADLADGTAEVTWTENGTRRHAPLAELP